MSSDRGADGVRVSGLNVFPIKSCKACRLQEVTIDQHGLAGDRRLMLVDESRRFVSQRKFPKLATVVAQRIKEGPSDEVLHVSAPGMSRDLRLVPVYEGVRVRVTIWEDAVQAVDQGDDAAQWFTEFLGLPATEFRLVASGEQSDSYKRLITNLPPSLRRGKLQSMPLALSDVGPISLVSQESLADLNQRIVDRGCPEVPLSRFRMNIELSGCSRPFEEDEWLLISIGAVPFLLYTNAEVSTVF